MRHGRYIYILGDIHGNFNSLNSFINKNIRQDKTLRTITPYWKKDGDDLQIIILQCGDVAWFWPLITSPVIRNGIDWLPCGRVPIYWTGGNHEDWDALDRLGAEISEVAPGIFYCPFGTSLEISPDITVLFAGGAESSDKDWRLSEMRRGAPKIWWEQEGISAKDMARLAFVPKADWVISHTAPSSFDVDKKIRQIAGYNPHINEPSRLKLEQVLMKYGPKRWFFGHFHHFMTGFTDGCEWECLSDLNGRDKFWDKVYIEWND